MRDGMRPAVAVARVADVSDVKSVSDAVARCVRNSCSFGDACSGKRVVVKPNVFCPLPAPVTTDPRVIAALIKLAYESGARRVTVAEGRSISTAKFRSGGNTTRACFEATGMDKAAIENGADIVYLEEDEFVEVTNRDAVVLKTAHIPRTILEAEAFINVPVLKNHSLALVTLGIKNLHGIISDEDKLFAHDYARLCQKLVDILRYKKPDLTVIDGIRGLESDHAEFGRPVDTGIIVSSKDTVAADAVGAAIMGLANLEVDTARLAYEQGLGVGDLGLVDVLGENLDNVAHCFSRPDIEISEQRFPGLKVRAGEHCKSCAYYIRRGIDRLVDEGMLDPQKPLTLVFGREPDVPSHIEGSAVIVGDCAIASESVRRLRDALWLTGRLKVVYCCPPMEFRMRAVELAGD